VAASILTIDPTKRLYTLFIAAIGICLIVDVIEGDDDQTSVHEVLQHWIYGKSLSEKVPSIKEITFDSSTASAKG
jgi:hypothetical protein